MGSAHCFLHRTREERDSKGVKKSKTSGGVFPQNNARTTDTMLTEGSAVKLNDGLTGNVLSCKDVPVAEFENATNGDETTEKVENSLSLSKKRCTLEEEKGQPIELRTPKIPKIRKTVRGWFRGTPFRSPLQGGLKGLGAGGGGTKV